MNSESKIVLAASAMKLTQAGINRASRAGVSLGASLMDRFRARFSEAVEQFHFVFDQESRKAQPGVRVIRRPKYVSRRLVGFLIPRRSHGVLEIVQGRSFLAVKESGELELLRSDAELEADYELDVKGDKVWLEAKKPKIQRRRLETNESIELGGRIWIVKLLPETLQTDRQIPTEEPHYVTESAY